MYTKTIKKIESCPTWSHRDSVELAVYCARLVLSFIFSLPTGDNRPLKAVQAVETWIKNPSEENRLIAIKANAYTHPIRHYGDDAIKMAIVFACDKIDDINYENNVALDTISETEKRIDAWIDERIRIVNEKTVNTTTPDTIDDLFDIYLPKNKHTSNRQAFLSRIKQASKSKDKQCSCTGQTHVPSSLSTLLAEAIEQMCDSRIKIKESGKNETNEKIKSNLIEIIDMIMELN